jgi:hypothetical protein
MGQDDDALLAAEELIKRAAAVDNVDTFKLVNRYLGLANAKIALENNRITECANELAQEQIRVNEDSNRLAERQLLSSEEAGRQSERNAELMNSATQQLAKSTKSLNKATWALVCFTAVQAVIALIALYVSAHGPR